MEADHLDDGAAPNCPSCLTAMEPAGPDLVDERSDRAVWWSCPTCGLSLIV